MLAMKIYDILAHAASAAAPLLSLAGGKTSRGISARRGLRERWIKKSACLDRGKRTLWFHVSSAGEFLQARPVMDLLAERLGDSIQIALTFFSPSGYDYYTLHDRAKRNAAVAFVDYLPFDTLSNSKFSLDTIRPDLIVYVKYDIWPNLVTEASSRDIPQALLSASFPDRPGGLKKALYGKIYPRLSAIAAIRESDARRFESITRGNVSVAAAGDMRFDQVIERLERSSVKIDHGILSDGRAMIVAGSTWPEDERVVIPGFATLLRDRPDAAALIIAPHEPVSSRLEGIEKMLSGEGLTCVRLSKAQPEGFAECDVLVADGIGYLAELYRAGRIAYVGGGWTTGVHNILEPAVLGLPVFFGPRNRNAWEASPMIEAGFASVVGGPGDFAEQAAALLADSGLIAEKSRSAAEFVKENSGASRRCADLLESLLA